MGDGLKAIIKGLCMIIASIVLFYVIFTEFNPQNDIFFSFMNACLLIGGISVLDDGVEQFSQSRKK
jgi:hypothetical protein